MIRYGANALRVQRSPVVKRSAAVVVFGGHARERIFNVLLTAARRGEPCPTNEEIAGIVGIDDSNVAWYIDELKNLGRISVQRIGRGSRIVKITGTPHQTQRTRPKCGRRVIYKRGGLRPS